MSDNKAATDSAAMAMPLTIRAQYVKDLSFEIPNPLAAFSGDGEQQPSISVDIQAKAQDLGHSNFEVVLEVKAEAQRQEQVLFIVELSYGAVVSIGDVPEESVAPLVMVETPHLIFPFVRQIIADTTVNGGFPPLFLSPVDFTSLYNSQQQSAGVA